MISYPDSLLIRGVYIQQNVSPFLTDPAMVFSPFEMDKLGNISRHHWKEPVKISELAKFESDKS